MKNTATTTYRDDDLKVESFRAFEVPGNGLSIEIEINARAIKIIPRRQNNHTQVKGTRFTKSCVTEYFEFAPEEYKEFWKEYRKNSWYNEDCARMRKALSYALHKYEMVFGKIFA